MARNNIRGVFPSAKMGRPILFQSLIERDYLCHLEFDREVESFRERPFTLSLKGDRSRTYRPDFQVVRDGQSSIVECASALTVGSARWRTLLPLVELWCAENEHTFEFVTDEKLRAGCRLRNIRLLRQFEHYDIPESQRAAVLEQLCHRQQPVTVEFVTRAVNPEQPERIQIPILHMAWHHEVELGLDEAPIGPSTQIWRQSDDS